MTVRPGFVHDLGRTFDLGVGLLADSFLDDLCADQSTPETADSESTRITLSPTVQRFVHSDADVLMMYSARGEGKTVGAVARILRVAHDNPDAWPLKVSVVRDTWVNVERCLSLETLVLSPHGWIKAGDVAVGDLLIGVNGKPTAVLAVHARPPEPLWTVHFSDKTMVRVTGDHLWAVQGRWDREHPGIRNRRRPRLGWVPAADGLRVTTTDELRVRLQGNRRHQRAWSVPLVHPVRFPERPVPLDPYLLGVLLGDGGISGPQIRLTSADDEVLERTRVVLPSGVTLCHLTGYDYLLSCGRGRTNPVRSALRQLGLAGLKSPAKFVPEAYLWNTVAVRLAVLRGLMDTDGCVAAATGHVSFATTSERLAEGVEFLVRSLGGLTRRRVSIRSGGHWLRGRRIESKLPLYTVAVTMPPDVIPFALSRKATRAAKRCRRPWRWIREIKPAGHGPSVCFRVADPAGLFVVDDFVVTHNTVFETLIQGQRAGWWDIEFQAGQREAILDGGVARLYFFGMDRGADANKFQGFEAGLLWLEEPAPAADISSGIPSEVFAMGVSSLRQPGVRRPTVQITMNPPDRSHWTLELAETLEEAGHPHMKVEVFRIPTGENTHLPLGYRERMRLGLEAAQRPDLIRRLSGGNIGTVIVGVPVTPEFSDLHMAKKPIEIRLGWPTYRAYDAGLNPTCIHAQTTPMGHLNIIGCVVGMNMGMEELLEVHVIPWEAKMRLRTVGTIPSKRPRDDYGHVKAWSTARSMVKFRDIGDPACVQREQTHSERSVARIIENLLGTTFEKGRVELSARKNAMRAVMTRNIGRRPMLQIDPECVPLIEALEGAWHHMRFPSGKVSLMPVKDLACVDEKTEILTLDGFKTVDRISVGQAVWSYDAHARCVRPDRLLNIHRTPGQHRLMTWKSRSLSMAVTPNHRMLVSRGRFNGGPGAGVRWGPLHFQRADAVTDSTTAVPVLGDPDRIRVTPALFGLALCRRGEIEVEGIWCPQTERGTWVARRDGRVWVTGNSHPG